MTTPSDTRLPPRPPLTPEEQRQLFAALDKLARLRAELLAARGGRLFPNAWEEFPKGPYEDESDAEGT